MSQNCSFSPYPNNKLQLINKNISTHTRVTFKILLWSKSTITTCFVVFLHTALYKNETKEWGKSYVCKCVPHCANLFWKRWRKLPGGYSPENGIQICATLKTTFSCPPDPSLRPPLQNLHSYIYMKSLIFGKFALHRSALHWTFPQNWGKVQFLHL